MVEANFHTLHTNSLLFTALTVQVANPTILDRCKLRLTVSGELQKGWAAETRGGQDAVYKN